MKHVAFPTEQDLNAFAAEMVQAGVAREGTGHATVNRRESGATTPAYNAGVTGEPAAEGAGEGAVKGTGVGLAVGATAGVLTTAGVLGTAAATAATVATGGLALPVILGMAALGAGAGAVVGGVGGAAGAEEHHHAYDVEGGHYDALHTHVNEGRHVIAVEDSIPVNVLNEVISRHHGHLI